MSILEVKNLSVEYMTSKGPVKAIDGVSFSIERGEALGIVGESGCGKSTILKSLLRLLPENGVISEGQVLFDGLDLVQLDQEGLRDVRWKKIALINQAAMNAFNPVYRVGEQILEVMTIQGGLSRKEAQAKAIELFSIVGLDAKRLNDFPHQLSGGMRQRSMIAMALALDPQVIIADEPTTALDVVVQDMILRKIKELQKELDIAMVFVTHDISVVAEICERTMVMYSGKIAEQGTTRDIFKNAYHPYTLGLVNAFPNVTEDVEKLVSIPGYPPDLLSPPEGCRFAPRCPFAEDICKNRQPSLETVGENHTCACHFVDRVEEFRKRTRLAETWELKVQ